MPEAGSEAGCSPAPSPVCDPGAPGEECKHWHLLKVGFAARSTQKTAGMCFVTKMSEEFGFSIEIEIHYDIINSQIYSENRHCSHLITLQLIFYFIYVFIFLQLIFKTLNTVSLSTLFEEERLSTMQNFLNPPWEPMILSLQTGPRQSNQPRKPDPSLYSNTPLTSALDQ